MNMNKKKLLSTTATLSICAGVLGASATPVFANGFGDDVQVGGQDGIVPITMTFGDEDASTHAVVSFSYSVTANNGMAGQVVNGLKVFEGITKDIVISNTDVTIDKNEGNGSIDFSNVKFESAGIYRYFVTQNELDSDLGILADSSKYCVDVYVTYADDGTTEIAAITAYKTGEGISGADVLTDGGEKTGELDFASAFTNAPLPLEITKIVAGNAGDRNAEFQFELTVNGTETTPDGTEYTVTSNAADGASQTCVVGTACPVILKHNEMVQTSSLPVGIEYTVEEIFADDTNDGYTVTYMVNGNKDGITADTILKNEKMTVAKDLGKNTVEFTNTKDATAPTGVITNALPFAMMVSACAAGGVLVLKNRKKDEEN